MIGIEIKKKFKYQEEETKKKLLEIKNKIQIYIIDH